jgi:hypothetical protein
MICVSICSGDAPRLRATLNHAGSTLASPAAVWYITGHTDAKATRKMIESSQAENTSTAIGIQDKGLIMRRNWNGSCSVCGTTHPTHDDSDRDPNRNRDQHPGAKTISAGGRWPSAASPGSTVQETPAASAAGRSRQSWPSSDSPRSCNRRSPTGRRGSAVRATKLTCRATPPGRRGHRRFRRSHRRRQAAPDVAFAHRKWFPYARRDRRISARYGRSSTSDWRPAPS